MSFGVGTSQLPVNVRGGTLTNEGPDLLYYRASSPVSSTQNDGSVATGSSVSLDGTQYLISAGHSSVDISAPPLNVGPIAEEDLDQALAAKINTRIPIGRRVDLGSVSGSVSVTLTDTDDQGQVDIYLTATGDVVLTINGIQTVLRCTLRIVATQDAVGNHTLDIRNGLNGDQETIDINPAAGVDSFLYCYTDDGSDLTIAGPTVLAGTSSSTGIPQPTITGTLGVGNVLTAVPAAGLVSVTYQWTRDGANISAATASTYTQVTADIGHNVAVTVAGTPTATSNPVIVPTPDVVYVDTAAQSTSTSLSMKVFRPALALTGDVLYAVITVPGTQTITLSGAPPVDWAVVGAGRFTNSGGNFTQFVYWRRDDGTAGPWTFTMAASANYRSRTVAFRNSTASTPPHELVTQANGTFNSTVTLPSKTPGGTGRMYLGLVSFPSSIGVTWPGGTVTDASGSDYQKAAFKFLGAATGVTAVVNGTATANTHKSVVSLLILPEP